MYEYFWWQVVLLVVCDSINLCETCNMFHAKLEKFLFNRSFPPLSVCSPYVNSLVSWPGNVLRLMSTFTVIIHRHMITSFIASVWECFKPPSVIAVLVGFYRHSESPTHSHSSFILYGVTNIIFIIILNLFIVKLLVFLVCNWTQAACQLWVKLFF